MTSTTSTVGAFGVLADLLVDVASVVAQLTPEEYAESGVARVSGSIGGHVRHCLDHVLALERALETGEVDYDARRRHTVIERDRESAVLGLTAAAARLEQVSDRELGRPLSVRCLLSTDGRVLRGSSSIARELAFVVSHTIHHNAQIALLTHGLGRRSMPRRFGVAPATPSLAGVA